MCVNVSIVACPDYGPQTAKAALEAVLEPLGGLNWVQPGMKIAVKANLVARMKPETAAATHPVLVTELCRMLVGRGAQVVVGDSPGGPFTAAWVGGIYSGTGMRMVEESGAKLNSNYSTCEVSFPEGNTVKSFPFTSWLLEADAVIDFAKLKTHGMAGMTCAVKNFFGVIPGTKKAGISLYVPQHGGLLRHALRPRRLRQAQAHPGGRSAVHGGQWSNPGQAQAHGRPARGGYAIQR